MVVACRAKAGQFTLGQWRDYQFMIMYFRVLCGLIVVEFIELVLKFFDVHAVCNSAVVAAARNNSNYTGFSADGCEIFSNV